MICPKCFNIMIREGFVGYGVIGAPSRTKVRYRCVKCDYYEDKGRIR